MLFVVVFYTLLVLYILFTDIYISREIIRTRRLKTPYVSTCIPVQDVIIKYIQQLSRGNKKLRILDIGSGRGKMLFRINKKVSNVEIVGYEIDKLYYFLANLRNKWENISFHNDDINNLKDFNFNIILTFLLERQSKTLINLYKKFPVGAIVISNAFRIPFDDDTWALSEVKKSRFLLWKIYIYKKIR
jgi:SAM-dependent methyltransferase